MIDLEFLEQKGHGMMRLPDYEGEPQEDRWEPVVQPANTTFVWWCVICKKERPMTRKAGTITCPKCGTWLVRRALMRSPLPTEEEIDERLAKIFEKFKEE